MGVSIKPCPILPHEKEHENALENNLQHSVKIMLDTQAKSSDIRGMNKLPLETRVQILSMLCEGSSMRSISRVADVSINTVAKLLVDAGKACAAFHDAKVRDVKARRVQVDEIWSFTAAKQKNVPTMKKPVEGAGDTWTWTAIEADTKLLITSMVGGRDSEYAIAFMDDLRDRLANRVQLTSDGHKAYLEAVEGAFGADVDYAMLVKVYGAAPEGAQVRYSPAECIGAEKRRVEGPPTPSTYPPAMPSAKTSPCECRCAALPD